MTIKKNKQIKNMSLFFYKIFIWLKVIKQQIVKQFFIFFNKQYSTVMDTRKKTKKINEKNVNKVIIRLL